MLKWTTYDGTTGTRMPCGTPVITIVNAAVVCVERAGKLLYLHKRHNFFSLRSGVQWLPVPTPAECEAWEALREAAGKLADALPQNSTGAVMLREALAALETAEKEGLE